ncbi:FtsX-like permease family protein [Solihabitans fulvus]|uniref:FtsX-like permease family protein n=1 Tax=Solihabitans fulvus TaxID=1892852 RepID=A0A5B2WPL8_9PSEU|nr:FtsX-like permease family protein [Solihabitans fulvus]KAA2252878.1 FtsX-like permease family protein [Solihabitans fulvus]
MSGRVLSSPLGRIVRSGVGRKRVQTVVMTLTTLLAVAASVLAAGLLVDSQAPFERAFAAQHGAQLTAQINGATASAAQIAATAHAPVVTASAGPYPVASLHPVAGSGADLPAGTALKQMTVVGRSGPASTVDSMTLASGTWASGPDQVVLRAGPGQGTDFTLGSHVTFPDAPGRPTLTVVGFANSVSDTADAWVTPAQLTALSAGASQYQMLYRFTDATTGTQMNADRTAITAALPQGALTGAQSWLQIQLTADGQTAGFVPFVAAFGILGLLMSVLIVGIIVSGAVSSQTRRIGIIKALGFTPAQVVRAYIGQALIPAAVGAVLGVLAGNVLAIPALRDTETVYGTGRQTIPGWVDIAVAVTALALVVGAAWALALRAGRLRTVDAIAIGHAPPAGRGRWARRAASRLPLPRPVVIGLANPFTRPARTLAMTGAVLLGAASVTFALGLTTSLADAQHAPQVATLGNVVVNLGDAHPGIPIKGDPHLAAASPARVAADITAQPGTATYVGSADTTVGVAGITGGVSVIGFTGDTAWASYQMISGQWFTGPGQAVVPTRFLAATGDTLGDTVTLTKGGRQVSLRITGEALDTSEHGMQILTDLTSLDGLGLGLQPQQFNIQLTSGTDRTSYVDALNAKFASIAAQAQPNLDGGGTVTAAAQALAALLTVMIVAVAGLGVLNLVVLDTRQRVHDLGVFKALGMSPGQTIIMVLTSVAGIGLVAGIIGVPLGILTLDYVMPLMGNAIGTAIPSADINVYSLPELAALALGGIVIALAGAALPAGWAAGARPITALRAE